RNRRCDPADPAAGNHRPQRHALPLSERPAPQTHANPAPVRLAVRERAEVEVIATTGPNGFAQVPRMLGRQRRMLGRQRPGFRAAGWNRHSGSGSSRSQRQRMTHLDGTSELMTQVHSA
ncbi:MAG: hypothetical protein ACLQB1_06875, partial [Streptosporangiaceae bacterium]